MISEKVIIDGEEITLSADDNIEIRVYVNEERSLFLPLVYEGCLTICLTVAGLAALEEEIKYDPIKTVEFEENDYC